MTATIHRVLITIGSFFSATGAIWSLSEVEVLSIPPEVGAVSVLIGAFGMLAANVWRANWGVA